MEVWTFENLIRTFKYLAVFSTFVLIVKFTIFLFQVKKTKSNQTKESENFEKIDFDYLSIQSVFAFMTGFAWSGLIALIKLNLEVKTAMIVSIFVGIFFMLGCAFLMYKIENYNPKKSVVEDKQTSDVA